MVLWLAEEALTMHNATATVALALAATPYLLAAGRLGDAVAITESASAASAGMDAATAAAVESALGTALHREGHNEPAIAHLEHATLVLRATGQQRRAVRAARSLAQAHRETGNLRTARLWYDTAFSGFVAEGSLVSAAGAASDLAQLYKLQGDLDSAADMMSKTVQYAAQSLDVLEEGEPETNARSTLAWAQENLGAVRKRQYRIAEAITNHTASLQQFRKLGDTVGQGLPFAISAILPQPREALTRPCGSTS
jgi:tetratricopeptide (TPR) repeat protein